MCLRCGGRAAGPVVDPPPKAEVDSLVLVRIRCRTLPIPETTAVVKPLAPDVDTPLKAESGGLVLCEGMAPCSMFLSDAVMFSGL